ncbi:hypothetical protein ACWJJH_16290 [Endozoicomonadaceae bacterium StTr2]
MKFIKSQLLFLIVIGAQVSEANAIDFFVYHKSGMSHFRYELDGNYNGYWLSALVPNAIAEAHLRAVFDTFIGSLSVSSIKRGQIYEMAPSSAINALEGAGVMRGFGVAIQRARHSLKMFPEAVHSIVDNDSIANMHAGASHLSGGRKVKLNAYAYHFLDCSFLCVDIPGLKEEYLVVISEGDKGLHNVEYPFVDMDFLIPR